MLSFYDTLLVYSEMLMKMNIKSMGGGVIFMHISQQLHFKDNSKTSARVEPATHTAFPLTHIYITHKNFI